MAPQLGASSSSVLTVKNETSYKSPPSSISDLSQPECEEVRGRRPDRESSSTAKAEDESGDDKDGILGKPRKRKRSRKGLDKNFPCKHDGCGKKYSRAEHLYRHQLNHTPKKIYECDFPGCDRTFVRQDLCARHRERHTARGSHLQRKDPYLPTSEGRSTIPSPITGHHEHFEPAFRPSSATGGAPNNIPRSSTTPLASPHYISSASGHSPLSSRMPGFQAHRTSHPGVVADHMSSPHNQMFPRSTGYGYTGRLQRSNSDDQYYAHAAPRTYESKSLIDQIAIPRFDRHLSNGDFDPATPLQPQQCLPQSRSHTVTGDGGWRSSPMPYVSPNAQHCADGQAPVGYIHQQNCPPMLPLPPSGYPAVSQTSMPGDRPISTPAPGLQPSIETHSIQGMPGPSNLDQISTDSQAAAYSAQEFNPEAHNRSPFTLPEDWTGWLFNDPQPDFLAPDAPVQGSMFLGATVFMDESNEVSRIANGYEDILNGPLDRPVPQHPMSVTSIVDPAQTEAILSEEKWQQLLELIENRFNETDNAPVEKQKYALLHGNREDPHHVLSRSRMQTYIRSYWYHFHPQMPILHKPTFSATRVQNLLLIAVIAIGASCLDKLHGHEVTQEGAELSNFLAWHLRGEIFKDKDCTAPAKLWVFQALLLLEVYEKMYSTRLLHERAHIHHVATLTLMRRGPFMIGRSALDSPPTGIADKGEASINETRDQSYDHTPDQWWNHWINHEAQRRVAFAAFIIDSIHTTMFGHTATMLAHEMKLQLPCDEPLWSATSSAEVNRIENTLKESGIKPISFFDGLRNTLNNNSVRTNSFGRTALMAGLLSVSWHMNQRDLQVRSLGALKALGGKDIWRGTLTKAFDFWKSDFDQNVSSTHLAAMSNWYQPAGKPDEENIFESRTVLHHLAHMATHVDIVSCQIFAKAKRLLSRTTLPSDYTTAQRRIREHWAPKPSARDATFYALKFLAQVLTPETVGLKRSASEAGMGGPTAYSARDDFLINRPWVVYVAALIVWSYGYALDGSIKSPPDIARCPEKQTFDMRLFLERVGGVGSPEDLINIPDRNACMGLLYILKAMFERCRWELLHEGAKLLGNCIEMLQGADA
ncbi:MAG: hypothetical protein Q9204_003083 [Flavoplaca sp. TL-2023a]